MKIKVKKIHPDARLPYYSHLGDAAFDVCTVETKILQPGEQYAFHTGLALEFPAGYVAKVEDRSSMAKKQLYTSGGVGDANFRGEYLIFLRNGGSDIYEVKKGDRIAQIMMIKVEPADFVETKELSESARGEQGFGSSGR